MTAVQLINAIVYQARNLVNGHRYIGFTTQGLLVRSGQHLKDARGTHRQTRFCRAIRKYGAENFVFEIMGDFHDDEDLAKMYEREAIEAYKPEYNLSYGGEGGSLSPETRAKISAGNMGKSRGLGVPKSAEHSKRIGDGHRGKPKLSLRGRPVPDERRRKISASNMGHAPTRTGPHSEATKQKLREANAGQVPWIKGKNHGDETRQRMGVAARDRWAAYTDEILAGYATRARELAKKNGTPVMCVNDGKVFGSYTEAAIFYGVGLSSVRGVVTGRTRAVKGLVFKKVEK